MNRMSVTTIVAALVAASGAFAQNATPTGPDSTQPSGAAQSQSQRRPSQPHQPAKSAMSGARQQGPKSGNEVQSPSPNSRTQRGRAASSAQSATETRPDANYAHPSGQDSHPDNAPRTTKLAAARSKKDRESGRDRNPQATGHSKEEDQLGKHRTYTESGGKKADSSTVCSTARPTKDGGVDCGMSGNSATNNGRIVNKPH